MIGLAVPWDVARVEFLVLVLASAHKLADRRHCHWWDFVQGIWSVWLVELAQEQVLASSLVGLGRFDGAGVDLMGVGSTKVGRLVGRAVGLPSSSATFMPETSPSEVTTYNVVLSSDKARSETTSPSISSAHNCLPLKTSDE